MKKLVLSSVPQLAKLIESNPDLLNIPALSALRPIIESAKKKGCAACQRRVTSPSNAVRTQVEAILSTLTEDDYKNMKALLHMDKLCYYHVVNGKTDQTCI
jgi:hypothetical protein